ncbi:hypothetical protein [Melaminivora alkalimesophila]|uniref:Uncharacterized protein n=1 Tax=Melaminivora alkalimesophila TaxID=1165852 RepID=A0A317RA74_9BURK|nr:hypothetical protein [Melaminivora alkalimesophila]PWW44656.1 hypothetical protein DFR36_107123 [Melaminivora alkalimesophila]
MALALLAWKSLPFFTAAARRLRRLAQPAATVHGQHTDTPLPEPEAKAAAARARAGAGVSRPAEAQPPAPPGSAVPITVIPPVSIAVAAAATPPRRRGGVPVRVISRRHGDGSCRLLISGRMADVCAELDRLVLQ